MRVPTERKDKSSPGATVVCRKADVGILPKMTALKDVIGSKCHDWYD